MSNVQYSPTNCPGVINVCKVIVLSEISMTRRPSFNFGRTVFVKTDSRRSPGEPGDDSIDEDDDEEFSGVLRSSSALFLSIGSKDTGRSSIRF